MTFDADGEPMEELPTTRSDLESALRDLERAWSDDEANVDSHETDGSVRCIDCMFTTDSENCVKCTDCEGCVDCVKCTQCQGCENCHDCNHCRGCEACAGSSHLILSRRCVDCDFCFGCVGLVEAEFCILNEQYSREEYFARLEDLEVLER